MQELQIWEQIGRMVCLPTNAQSQVNIRNRPTITCYIQFLLFFDSSVKLFT